MVLETGNAPLFLGDRGIGKTKVAFEIAKELGLNVFYLNVSQVSAENLVFPVVREENKLDFLTPDLNNTLVILDEITNRSSLHSLLQSLVLEKRLGNTIYSNLHFIATGNKLENSSLVVDLPRPLLERFVIIDFPVPSIEEWVRYTINEGGSEKFTSFIISVDSEVENNKFYYVEELEGDSGLKQKPSPRNNTRTAILLRKYDEEIVKEIYGNNFDSEEEFEKAIQNIQYSSEDLENIKLIVAGSSGMEVAREYISYLKDGRYYNYEMFIRGIEPKNVNEVIALVHSAMIRLQNKKISVKEFDYKVLRYLDKNYPQIVGYAINVLTMYIDLREIKELRNDKDSIIAKVIEKRKEAYREIGGRK